jgi:hypothetical protein
MMKAILGQRFSFGGGRMMEGEMMMESGNRKPPDPG